MKHPTVFEYAHDYLDWGIKRTSAPLSPSQSLSLHLSTSLSLHLSTSSLSPPIPSSLSPFLSFSLPLSPPLSPFLSPYLSPISPPPPLSLSLTVFLYQYFSVLVFVIFLPVSPFHLSIVSAFLLMSQTVLISDTSVCVPMCARKIVRVNLCKTARAN